MDIIYLTYMRAYKTEATNICSMLFLAAEISRLSIIHTVGGFEISDTENENLSLFEVKFCFGLELLITWTYKKTPTYFHDSLNQKSWYQLGILQHI